MKIINLLLDVLINGVLYCRYPKHIRRFYRRVGYFPNISFPTLYHEKILWRKIFDHNPIFITFCDKIASKSLWNTSDLDVLTPQTVWIGDHAEDIPLQFRNSKYVLKTNHGCKFNYFFTGNDDISEIKRLADSWLKITYYGKKNIEWAYSHVPPKLFIEEKIITSNPVGLIDINIRCIFGRSILGTIILNNKKSNKQYSFFDINGNLLDLKLPSNAHNLPSNFKVPAAYQKAVSIAEKISHNYDFARYDFMSDGENIYGGEITVYPATGLSLASKKGQTGQDTIVNDQWRISTSWFMNNQHQFPLEQYKSWISNRINNAKH